MFVIMALYGFKITVQHLRMKIHTYEKPKAEMEFCKIDPMSIFVKLRTTSRISQADLDLSNRADRQKSKKRPHPWPHCIPVVKRGCNEKGFSFASKRTIDDCFIVSFALATTAYNSKIFYDRSKRRWHSSYVRLLELDSDINFRKGGPGGVV
jgi:hypothetical protein